MTIEGHDCWEHNGPGFQEAARKRALPSPRTRRSHPGWTGEEPMTENVTRIYPAPSILNPLRTNQWAVLTDAELAEEVARAEARIDAAQHTLAALERERARRATDGQEKNR